MVWKKLLLVISCFLFPFFSLNGAFFDQHNDGLASIYCADRLSLVALFLPENPVIFEAGGHYGTDTVRFAALWPKGRILSFEASPFNFQKFLQNTADIPQIHGFNLAVNNYNGTALFYACEDNPGASSLLPPSNWSENNYKGPRVEVPCVILDDWCREHQVDHIDFMWLDLEGLELQILQSSPKILSTVKVIYTETNFKEFRIGMSQYENLKTFLESNGFEMIAHWYLEDWQGDAIFVRKGSLDTKGIIYENLVQNPYFNSVPRIKQIFEKTHIKSFLEFGFGYGTKYLLDYSGEVTSYEIILPDQTDEWFKKPVILFRNYKNWTPILKHGSQALQKANILSGIHGKDPALEDATYLIELKDICDEIFANKQFDIVLIDPGFHMRGDLVNELFQRVPIIVVHDTNYSHQQYGWNKIQEPCNYTKIVYTEGQGVTVWIHNDRKDLILALTGGSSLSRDGFKKLKKFFSIMHETSPPFFARALQHWEHANIFPVDSLNVRPPPFVTSLKNIGVAAIVQKSLHLVSTNFSSTQKNEFKKLRVFFPIIHDALVRSFAIALQHLGHTIVLPGESFDLKSPIPGCKLPFGEFCNKKKITSGEVLSFLEGLKNVEVLENDELWNHPPDVFIVNTTLVEQAIYDICIGLQANGYKNIKLVHHSGNNGFHFNGNMVKNLIATDAYTEHFFDRPKVNIIFWIPWIEFEKFPFEGVSDNLILNSYLSLHYQVGFSKSFQVFNEISQEFANDFPYAKIELPPRLKQNEMSSKINESCATLHIKETEGFDYTIIESLAKGRPVFLKRSFCVGSRLMNWSIEGQTAFFFDDYQEFKRKVQPFIENAEYRHQIQKSCADTIRRIIDNEKQLLVLEKFLQDLK